MKILLIKDTQTNQYPTSGHAAASVCWPFCSSAEQLYYFMYERYLWMVIIINGYHMIMLRNTQYETMSFQ